MTERELLDLLHQRYDQLVGSGQRWVAAEQVRSLTGWGYGELRTCDFMAQDTWTGLQLHGMEVKTRRSDWLRELKDPAKAEAFRPYCHRWWLVTSGPEVATKAELPAGWGLLTAGLRGIRCVVTAPRMDPAPVPRQMQVTLLRAAARTAVRRAVLLTHTRHAAS